MLQGELPEKLKSLAELYAGCVAGAMQRDDYLQVIQDTGFIDMEVKKEHQFTVSDAILTKYLSEDDINLYRRSNTGVFSLTVFGKKPADTK